MPKIDTYPTKVSPVDGDSVLGINSTDSSVARFVLSDLSTYFGTGEGGGGSAAATTRIVQLVNAGTSSQSFTSMPLAETEWHKRLRRIDNFSGFTSLRLTGYVVGTAPSPAELFIEYTTDLTGATGWTDLGTALPVDSNPSDAPIIGDTVTIPSGAKAAIMIRVMGRGGNATNSPSVSNVNIELIP
jgi:hypothetical protein